MDSGPDANEPGSKGSEPETAVAEARALVSDGSEEITVEFRKETCAANLQ